MNDEDSTPWKLCAVSQDRTRVLEESYNNPIAGHLEVRKTTLQIASRYYCSGMSRDVRKHVRHFQSCQQFKVNQQKPTGEMLT